MNNIRTYINIFFSIVSTQIVALLGGWDFSLKLLVMLIAFDYITGIFKAAYQRNLSSSVGFWGILKKMCIFIVVATASMLDHLVVQNAPVIRTVVIYFYVSNEGISMLENLSALGVPVPEIIKDRLFKFSSNNQEVDR